MSLRVGQENGVSENGSSEGMVENWGEGGSLGLTAVHPWSLPGQDLETVWMVKEREKQCLARLQLCDNSCVANYRANLPWLVSGELSGVRITEERDL